MADRIALYLHIGLSESLDETLTFVPLKKASLGAKTFFGRSDGKLFFESPENSPVSTFEFSQFISHEWMDLFQLIASMSTDDGPFALGRPGK